MGEGITFVGLDAHKASISVAMLLPNAVTPIEWQLPNHTNWGQAHRLWVGALRFEYSVDQAVLDDYLLAIDHLGDRLKALSQKLEEVSREAPYAEPVAALVLPRLRSPSSRSCIRLGASLRHAD